MAVPQDKVMLKLNETFKGKSITEHYKKAIAASWAAKIETEEGIDAYIQDRKEDILEASKEADRIRTEATKAKEDLIKKVTGDEGKKPEETKTDLPEGTPEYMKVFMTELKETKQALATLQASKQAETVDSKFKSHEGLKGIPPEFYKRAIPTKEEDIETTVADIAKDWGAIQTQYKFSAFGGDKPVNRLTKTPESGNADEKPDDTVAAYAKAQNDKFINEQSKN